jgi:hypothetical protein
MNINIHVLLEMIAEYDPAIINVHEVELDDVNDNIKITYDVVIPQKSIVISKKAYIRYLRGEKLDDLLEEE